MIMNIDRKLLWVFFFCYSTMAALLFQKLLLPLFPSLHGGNGLLLNDAQFFHATASVLADRIHAEGWGVLSFWNENTSGNVTVATVLYVLFGKDPAVMVPVNAAFHATSGLMIYLIGLLVVPRRAGKTGALIAAVLFVAFPSALMWYGQIHKDSYSILGILLIAYSTVAILKEGGDQPNIYKLYAAVLTGIALLLFVRPYYISILTVTYILLSIVAILYVRRNQRELPFRVRIRATLFYATLVILCGITVIQVSSYVKASGKHNLDASVYGTIPVDDWEWHKTTWLPQTLDRQLEIGARTRVGLINYSKSVNAQSLIDGDVTPDSLSAMVAYIPRGIQLGLFAPFPTTWLDEGASLMRLAVIPEMLVWYVLFFGLALHLYKHRSPQVMAAIVFSMVFITIFGMLEPNVGTLYRKRYVFLFILVLVSAQGWTLLLDNIRTFRRRAISTMNSEPQNIGKLVTVTSESIALAAQPRSQALRAGGTVIAITFLVYIGFFLRDMLMARMFGAGNELDAFYIGIMLPMFLVTVISVPIGAVLTPIFTSMCHNTSQQDAVRFMQMANIVVTGFLAILAICLYISFPFLMDQLVRVNPQANPALAREITTVFLVILVLSGSVIIGNSILNAKGKFLLPAAAQLTVPVVAVSALLIWGGLHGVSAVAYGMLIGQVTNLALVIWLLRRDRISLLPAGFYRVRTSGTAVTQYISLSVSAFLVAVSLPIGNAIAATLPSGNVAMFGIGNRITLFVTGLVGVAVSTVMVPYFSSLMATMRHVDARKDLDYFLVLATLLTIPVSILLFLEADNVTQILFGGGAMQAQDLKIVATIVQYGIIQLPFFAAATLLMKYLIAGLRSGYILIAAVAGASANIACSLVLITHMGVGGIAMANTISVMLLLVFMHRSRNLSLVSIGMLFLNWLLFLTMVVSLHYSSPAGVVGALIAYLVLVAYQLRELFIIKSYVSAS